MSICPPAWAVEDEDDDVDDYKVKAGKENGVGGDTDYPPHELQVTPGQPKVAFPQLEWLSVAHSRVTMPEDAARLMALPALRVLVVTDTPIALASLSKGNRARTTGMGKGMGVGRGRESGRGSGAGAGVTLPDP